MTNHTETSQVMMTAAELAERFGVHESSFHKLYSRDGFPERQEMKMDVRAVCEWILENTGSKRSKLWTGANLFLGGGRLDAPVATAKKAAKAARGKPRARLTVKKSPAKKATAKKSQVAKSAAIPKAVSLDTSLLADTPDEDFGVILDSFRRTVSESVRLCEQASVRGNESLLTARLKTSGAAIEQLRKAEQSILDIQLARKSSLPVDEVRVAFVSLASSIRSKLLQLPIKLSHELSGTQTAGEAQAILDEEIRMVLNDLSKNPFGTN